MFVYKFRKVWKSTLFHGVFSVQGFSSSWKIWFTGLKVKQEELCVGWHGRWPATLCFSRHKWHWNCTTAQAIVSQNYFHLHSSGNKLLKTVAVFFLIQLIRLIKMRTYLLKNSDCGLKLNLGFAASSRFLCSAGLYSATEEKKGKCYRWSDGTSQCYIVDVI